MIRCPECEHENDGTDPACEACGADLEGDRLGEQVVALLRDDRKIEAIKVYREAKDVGLEEAKDAVEAIGARHGIAKPAGGCAILLIAVGASLGALGLVVTAAG